MEGHQDPLKQAPPFQCPSEVGCGVLCVFDGPGCESGLALQVGTRVTPGRLTSSPSVSSSVKQIVTASSSNVWLFRELAETTYIKLSLDLSPNKYPVNIKPLLVMINRK